MKSDTPQELGRKAERKSMDRMGARQVRGSGAWAGAKGDGRVDAGDLPFLVEHKATPAGSFSVKLDTLAKVAREARAVGRMPALEFVFVDGQANPRPNGAWVAIPEGAWVEILDRLRAVEVER